MVHGINANLLRRWVHEAEMKPRNEGVRTEVVDSVKAPEPKTVFLPVSLPAPAPRTRPQTSESSCGVDHRRSRWRGRQVLQPTALRGMRALLRSSASTQCGWPPNSLTCAPAPNA